MMVIGVSNQKGGCGKTTTAINLAASMAHLGKRTLLIDLDPQAHASMGLGFKPEDLDKSIYNVLTDRADRQLFIESVIRPYGPRLDVAPSHVLLSTIEQEYSDKENAVNRLHQVLEHLAFPYECIILDCPPSLGFLTFNALRASDAVIVPIELSSFSLMGVSKLVSMIELIRVKLHHAPKVYALPTMVDLRSNFSRNMLTRISEAFPQHTFDRYIRMSIACRESQALGIPLLGHKPAASACQDYLGLAREITQRVLEEPVSLALTDESELSSPRSLVRDFTINAPEASHVYVVGDFNQWKMDSAYELWNSGKGVWRKRVILPPGRHRYKFVVDGKWCPDPSNPLAEANPFGGIDSVLEID